LAICIFFHYAPSITKECDIIEFSYHWLDKGGVQRFTIDRDEADKALHEGFTVYINVINKRRKDGSDRIAV